MTIAADIFDVLEVEIAAPHRIRKIATQEISRNADAIVSMAVMRRDAENYFFTTAVAGIYKDGDCWQTLGFEPWASENDAIAVDEKSDRREER